MTLYMVVNRIMDIWGGRVDYAVVPIPIVLLMLQLVLWKIRSRPPDAAANAGKAAKAALPGAELGETVSAGRPVLDSPMPCCLSAASHSHKHAGQGESTLAAAMLKIDGRRPNLAARFALIFLKHGFDSKFEYATCT